MSDGLGILSLRCEGIKEMDERVKNSRVTQPFLSPSYSSWWMTPALRRAATSTWRMEMQLAAQWAIKLPLFSRFHRGLRPALILHTVTELPDGFILHPLPVFKPKSDGEGDGASLNLFHLLVCSEENWQTDRWQTEVMNKMFPHGTECVCWGVLGKPCALCAVAYTVTTSETNSTPEGIYGAKPLGQTPPASVSCLNKHPRKSLTGWTRNIPISLSTRHKSTTECLQIRATTINQSAACR